MDLGYLGFGSFEIFHNFVLYFLLLRARVKGGLGVDRGKRVNQKWHIQGKMLDIKFIH